MWFNFFYLLKYNIFFSTKKVQTGLDAVKAAQLGCSAIILSNHGGRNLDTSRSGIEVLPEVMRDLSDAGLSDKIEVFVDGGIRRGTDILKCIALGAKAVGLGKPAVYAMSAYGQAGIERMLQILKEELILGMRLCGVRSLDELTPAHVNSMDLERHGGAFTPIPPSPYAYHAPKLGVRSPAFPKKKQTIEELEKEIILLQKQLNIAEGKSQSRRNGCLCMNTTFINSKYYIPLLLIMMKSIIQTTFARTLGGMLHRSALFLILFLIIQGVANVSLLFGNTFHNSMIHMISSTTIWRYFEWYLLVTTIVHVCAAMYFTFNKSKFIKKAPIKNGKLAISGTVLSIFLGYHYYNSTLSVVVPILSNFHLPGKGGVPLNAQPKDIYQLQNQLYGNNNIFEVVLYFISVFSIGIHLKHGWRKAVLKMDVSKSSRIPFTSIGNALIIPLLVTYTIAPLLFFLYPIIQMTGHFSNSEL